VSGVRVTGRGPPHSLLAGEPQAGGGADGEVPGCADGFR